MTARLFVEEDGRFERRPGEAVFDARHGVAEVEPSRGALAFVEQASEPPPQHAGAGEGRLALFSPRTGNRRPSRPGPQCGAEPQQILADNDCGNPWYRWACARPTRLLLWNRSAP